MIHLSKTYHILFSNQIYSFLICLLFWTTFIISQETNNTTKQNNQWNLAYTTGECLNQYEIAHQGNCTSVPISFELCSPFFTEVIWIPEGETQQTLSIKLITQISPMINFIYNNQEEFILEYSVCARRSLHHACTNIFKPCSLDPLTNTYVPIQVCMSACQELQRKCKTSFEKWPELGYLFNCENCSSQTSGTYVYNPKKSSKEVIEKNILSLRKVITNTSGDVSYHPDVGCAPFIGSECLEYFEENARNPVIGDCGLQCPGNTWDDSQLTTIKNLTTSMSILSLVTTLVIITTLLSSNKRRVFPNNLPLLMSFSSFGLSFGYLFEGMVGYDEVWCSNISLCRFQGWMIVFFTLSVTGWWFSICLNVFFSSVYIFRQRNVTITIYILFGWGIPFIISITLLALDKIDYTIGENTCDVYIPPGNADDPKDRIWAYYIPVFSQLGLGTILISTIFFHLWKRSDSWKTYKTLVRAQIGLILFMLIFLLDQSFYFAFFLDRSVNFYSRIKSFLTASICAKQRDTGCPEIQDIWNYDLYLLSIIASAGQGVFVFLLFGSSLDKWKDVLSQRDKSASWNRSMNSLDPQDF